MDRLDTESTRENRKLYIFLFEISLSEKKGLKRRLKDDATRRDTELYDISGPPEDPNWFPERGK